VQSVAIATDDQGRAFALSAGSDYTVRYWEVATGREVLHFAQEGPVYAVAFSTPDHRRALSAGSDRIIRLWDLDKDHKDREIGRFIGHQKAVYAVASSADGRRVLSGSGDGTIRLWDAATGFELDRLGHDEAVYSVAFSPVGPARALSASGDKSVRLWDFWDDKGKLVFRFDGPAPVLCAAFSPDGHRALSGGEDGALTLWDLDRGVDNRRFPGSQDYVLCVTFLPDGRHALSGTVGGKLIVWDVEELRPLHSFEGAVGHLGVAAMADGCHALTADADGVVRPWKLPELAEPAGPPEGGPRAPAP
jgi:WD40 repeat protein